MKRLYYLPALLFISCDVAFTQLNFSYFQKMVAQSSGDFAYFALYLQIAIFSLDFGMRMIIAVIIEVAVITVI